MFQVKYMALLDTSIRRKRHENVMSSVMRKRAFLSEEMSSSSS